MRKWIEEMKNPYFIIKYNNNDIRYIYKFMSEERFKILNLLSRKREGKKDNSM